jgi:hypothetical protein
MLCSSCLLTARRMAASHHRHHALGSRSHDTQRMCPIRCSRDIRPAHPCRPGSSARSRRRRYKSRCCRMTSRQSNRGRVPGRKHPYVSSRYPRLLSAITDSTASLAIVCFRVDSSAASQPDTLLLPAHTSPRAIWRTTIHCALGVVTSGSGHGASRPGSCQGQWSGSGR